MLLGYAGVLIDDQDMAAHTSAQKRAGYERVFGRKPLVAVGTGANRSGSAISCGRVTWLWSGSWIGCPGPCSPCL